MPILDKWLFVEVIYQYLEIFAYAIETFVIFCLIYRAWIKHKRYHDLKNLIKH